MKKMFNKVGYVVSKLIAIVMAALTIVATILIGVNPANNFVWFVIALIAMVTTAIWFDITHDFEMNMKKDRKDRRDRYYSLQKD